MPLKLLTEPTFSRPALASGTCHYKAMSQISPLTLDGHKIPLLWVSFTSRPKGILAFPQAGILDCQPVLERSARAGGFLGTLLCL